MKGWFNKVGEIDIASKNHTLFMCLRSFTFIYIVLFKGDKSVHQQTEATQFFLFLLD